MNMGTLSGTNVLEIGELEPGAIVKLRGGGEVTVLAIRRNLFSRHNFIPGSARVKIRHDDSEEWISGRDISTIIAQPVHASNAA
jgi:hypothetical protein